MKNKYMQTWLLGLCLISVTAACYWPGLAGPWLFDDIPHLLPLVEEEQTAGNWRNIIFNKSGPLKRPVAMATFHINAKLSGSDLWWWKFTNLLIHLATGIAIFCFTLSLLSVTQNINTGKNVYLALIISGIWLLHPLQVSTVLYTVQRMTQLSALFVFLGLLAYLCGRCRQIEGRQGTGLIMISFLVFFPLGIFSKENALLMPVYCLLLEILVFRFRTYPASGRGSFWLKIILIGPLLAGLVFLLSDFQGMVLDKYIIREFGLAERLLTQSRVIWLYLLMLFLPAPKYLGFLHDDILISQGLFEPVTTFFSILFILVLIAAAWWYKKANCLVTFGVLFFFSAHLLESTIFPLELMFEHRNYIASYGMILGLVLMLTGMVTFSKVWAFPVTAVLIVLISLTMARVDAWSSFHKLLDYVYTAHPQSRRIIALQVDQLAQQGDHSSAMQLLEGRVGIGEHIQKLNIICMQKKTIATQEITMVRVDDAAKLDMYAISQLQKLSLSALSGTCDIPVSELVSLLDEMLQRPMTDKFEGHKLYVYKAHLLWRQNLPGKAFSSIEMAVRVFPDDPVPLLLASEWSVRMNDLKQAEQYLSRAGSVVDRNNPRHLQLEKNVKGLIESAR